MAIVKKPVTQVTFNDVSKPGAPSTTTSATSRAIIIKHQTVQDPMVNETPTTEAVKTEESAPVTVTSPSAKKIVIKPIHEHLDDPEVVEVTIPKTDQPETTEVKIVDEPKAPEIQTPEPVIVNTNEEKPVIDDEAKSADRSKLIEQLVVSQEYFLPIETNEQRRSKRTAIFGTLTIIVLLLALYNVTLDANLLPNTFNVPHTSFFSAK